MYTKITNPSIEVYDGDTNQFLGQYSFALSPESEQELLQWLNIRKPIPSLIALNMSFPEPVGEFALAPNRVYPRRGIFRATLTDSGTTIGIPIEISGTYDMKLRSSIPGIYSAEFSNIVVDSIKEGDID